MQTWNKWEWSEFYVFLKIISEKKIYAADKNLDIIPDKFLLFHRIIREEILGEKKIFNLFGIPDNAATILDSNAVEIFNYSDSELPKKIIKIFESIKIAKDPSFLIPLASNVMDEIGCAKIKASSGRKEDIVGVIDDRISPWLEELWFSIKSMLGSPSTLLNAGDTTNLVFQIDWFSGEIEDVNSIQSKSKIRDRIKKIKSMGGKIIFLEPKNKIFSMNLRKIDSIFSKILATMALEYYEWESRTVVDLVKICANSEFREEIFTESDLEYKVKSFLDAIALWMVPSKVWSWESSARWGYIVVKESGDIVCYHLYNRDEFRSYLYENTRFDTPSSTRHKFGSLYLEWGKLLFNLNIQIRFH